MIYPWQQIQWQIVSQQIHTGRLAHAMLLTGVAGMGKLHFANQLAATVLCSNNSDQGACGQCHSCKLFAGESHPDHTLIAPEEAGKQIKIEQVRSLKDKQELTPTVSKWKTVIVNPADSMNISSNNSLLKLLEEPQDNTLIILISAYPEKLPITIISRCQQLVFSLTDNNTALQYIQNLGLSADQDNIERLLKLAKSAPLKVIELLESDVIQQVQAIEADFEMVLKGQGNPVQMAQNWQKYDLQLCFNHLQTLIQQRLVNLKDTLHSQQAEHYWYIYDCIVKSIKLTSLSNNINKILLIEQFIVSVMDKNWNQKTIID